MGKLTTASLIGGETSRSFHYWQPASIWRLLPWLANPGNQAMRPHTGNGNRHLSHWINSGKREGRGGGNCLDEELSLLTTLQVHAQSTCKNASNEDCMEFQCMSICEKLLTIRKLWCFLFILFILFYKTVLKTPSWWPPPLNITTTVN